MHYQEEAMQESSGKGDTEEERREVAGLDFSILNIVVSIEAGALFKLSLLLAFLSGCFHHFNTGNGLCQHRVDLAKLIAHLIGNWLKLARVMAQRNDEYYGIQNGRQQQLWLEKTDKG